jgi:hypothetical protein
MQNSSDDLLDVTNEIGLSGKFLKLARNGQLAAVSSLIQNRVTIAKDLAAVEEKLKACNDPAMLAEFEKWCRKGKRDFEATLCKLAGGLEHRKCRLLGELRQIDQRLDQEEVDVEWAVNPAPMTSLVPRLERKGDTFVAERNEIIDENLRLSSKEICKLLDLEFGWEGRECGEHLPKTWVRSYRVDSFIAAYQHPKCRNLVHRLISGRRGLSNYQKT